MTPAGRSALLPAPLRTTWDRSTSRERRIVALGALVVGCAAFWWLVWQPINVDIERSRAELARRIDILAATRTMADESASLARDARPARSTDPRTAIARAFAERGMRPASAPESRDGRVAVVLPDARFDALLIALDVLRKEDGIYVAEATLTPRVEPGTVRAELLLAR